MIIKKPILLLLLIVPVCLVGKNVKKETILKVAEKVYRKDFPATQNAAFEDVNVVKNETDTVYYIVSYPKGGFVIVSADSLAPPVLGKCKKGVYNPEKLPPGLLVLLERYKFSIAKMKVKGIKQSDRIKEQWDEYMDENYLTLKSYSVGSHLVSTEWGQENGYNRFCPTGCPAGCSAVAMAQVLWHWKCRIASDWGSYNWDLMGESVANDRNALLIYHCGLASDTDYDTDESSTTPNKIKNGLDDHMGCKSDVNVIWQNSHLFNWREWLEDEIDAERPIIYNAGNFEFAGHSWVIDGYDSVGKFYCNWGYDGDYNGWFSLGDFEIPIGSWNTFDSAVIKIIPEQDNGVGTPQIPSYNFTYNPNGYEITIPGVFGATRYEWTTNHGTIIGTGTTAILKSDCSATVQVRAYNENCRIYSAYLSGQVTINYDPILGPSAVCPSGATFTINNLPPVNSIEWICGPYLSVSTGQNTASCTFVVTGTGNSYINARVYTTCGGSYLSPIPVLVYSSPTQFGVNNFNNLEMLDGRMFKILPSSGAYPYRGSLTVSGTPNSSYSWTQISSYPNDIGWSANGATVDVYTRFANKSVRLRCTETNSCTSSYKDFTFTTTEYIIEFMSISPNPATGETTIFIDSGNEATKDISGAEWDLEIYDQSQQLKMKKAKLKGNEFKVNTSGWKEGVYIVRAKVGDKILSEKMVVKH